MCWPKRIISYKTVIMLFDSLECLLTLKWAHNLRLFPYSIKELNSILVLFHVGFLFFFFFFNIVVIFMCFHIDTHGFFSFYFWYIPCVCRSQLFKWINPLCPACPPQTFFPTFLPIKYLNFVFITFFFPSPVAVFIHYVHDIFHNVNKKK